MLHTKPPWNWRSQIAHCTWARRRVELAEWLRGRTCFHQVVGSRIREDARRVIRIDGLFRKQVRTEGTSNVIRWRTKTAHNVGSEHCHANREKINLSCRRDLHDGAFFQTAAAERLSTLKLFQQSLIPHCSHKVVLAS